MGEREYRKARRTKIALYYVRYVKVFECTRVRVIGCKGKNLSVVF